MARTLNVSLTDELRRYVDSRAGDEGMYATPSEYIRDLIRRDMENWRTAREVARGYQEARNGRAVEKSVMDILDEA